MQAVLNAPAQGVLGRLVRMVRPLRGALPCRRTAQTTGARLWGFILPTLATASSAPAFSASSISTMWASRTKHESRCPLAARGKRLVYVDPHVNG